MLLELKGARELSPEHEAQLLNYLKATRIEVGLLHLFGVQPTIKRKVFDIARKASLSWVASATRQISDTD